nr:hypothetical protein [Tanacetum cinerariifolium]
DLAKQADSRTSFNELMDTPVDFSAFLMNRLKVDTLTPELLARLTYELMKGSCKSLVELEFFLKEVYKATIDQLDWNNPEGHQYPHDLLKPLPLIPNSRSRRVIPFDHFINNDLEYLRGGASSRKYTTFVTKTKAANYGHIKWIEYLDLAQCGVKHRSAMINMLSGESLIGGANVNNSMVLLSIGNLLEMSIPNVESTLSPNFKSSDGITTSIWIGSMYVEMMTRKADQSHCKRTFCFQHLFKNVHEKHRHPMACGRSSIRKLTSLTPIQEDSIRIRTSRTDDHLKGIRMKYLPQTIGRRSNKERAATMIQAIDKQLKTRRIMRSLEKFVGGRLYEEDFRMLQRT